MKTVSRWLGWSTLFVVLAAPAVSGCQPPWAWGFLLAFLFFSAALLLVLASFEPEERQAIELLFSAPLRPMAWAGLAALVWATALFGYDLFMGAPGGRLPALALDSLAFTWVFSAAFILGLRWGVTGRRLRRIFFLTFWSGVAFACVSILQRAGWWPQRILDWTQDSARFSGMYSNANRYAVLLALGWACGVAGLGAALALAPARSPGASWLGKARALAPGVLGLAAVAAGLSYSQSRLTILALAVVLGLAVLLELRWVLRAKRGARGSLSAVRSAWEYTPRAASRSSLPRAVLIPLALLLPGLLVLASVLFFSGSPLAARWSELADLRTPDPAQRVKVLRAGWELLREEPLRGHGQGSFETAFRMVQPDSLGGRWVQAHSDWLQIGIELGWPGLAFTLACAGAWFYIWWRAGSAGSAGRGPFRFRLLAYGGMAVGIPLLCSLADFPLREPATATLFFFLAGALTAAHARVLRRPEWAAPRNARWMRIAPVGFFLLAGLFACLGVHTFRVGAAVARSPWMGTLFPPAPKASEAGAYRAALKLAPNCTELLYPLARTQLAALQAAAPPEKSAAREGLLETLEAMHAVNPRDHRIPWLRSFVCAEEGDLNQAADLLDRSVELAPAYPQLREQALSARLFEIVPRLEAISPLRREQLEQVFRHMRRLLRTQPYAEDACLASLAGAGVQVHEIADLWQAGEAGAALSRARFWMANGGWYMARQELAWVVAQSGEEPWLDLLQGRLALEEGRWEDGLAGMRRGLQAADAVQAAAMERWMIREVERLPAAALVHLAKLESLAAAWPRNFTLALATRLIEKKYRREATRLLLGLAESHPGFDLFRRLAELAGEMNDPWAARAYAEKAWERSNRSTQLRTWLDTFRVPEATPTEPLE